MSDTPTAAAMRAAKLFCSNPPESLPFRVVARAIDEQTGLPELIAATRAILAWWNALPQDTKLPLHDYGLAAVRELRRALEKAEGRS